VPAQGLPWDEPIVRLTRQYHTTAKAPLKLLYVVVTYVVRGTIIELRQFCGHVMALPRDHPVEWESNTAAEAQAEVLLEALRQTVLELGLQIRAGVYDH
jgi:hypothetical protein